MKKRLSSVQYVFFSLRCCSSIFFFVSFQVDYNEFRKSHGLYFERPVWSHGLTKRTTDGTIVSSLQGVKLECNEGRI